MSDDSDFSLASLAQLDTSDVAVIASRLPAEGVFTCQVKLAQLAMRESTNPDRPDPMVFVNFEAEIIEADPKKKDLDPESFIGRTLKESALIRMDDIREAIGLLKGRYKRAGLPTDGVLGGVEGSPGWIDGAVDRFVKIKVRHYTTKSGDERAGYDWVGSPTAIGESEAA